MRVPFYWKLVGLLILVVAVGYLVSGCARPQPMGETVWIGWKEMNR